MSFEHPSDDDLKAYASGRQLTRVDELEHHLSSCKICIERIGELSTPRDDFANQLRSRMASAEHETSVSALESTIAQAQHAGRPEVDENSEFPETLGHYKVVRLLGRGAFGFVYLAEDTERQVAVKVLHSATSEQASSQDLFRREAETLRTIKHPAIVKFVETFTTEDGKHCLVTEYLSGGTLGRKIGNSAFSPQATAEFIAPLADALHEMHIAGYTHRDVKPENILLNEDDAPRLADVGLALSDEAYGMGERQVAGSLCYLSPEQSRGDSHLVDGRTDVYSLGIVMYEMLTGRRPFKADKPSELLRRIQEIAIKPPRQINSEIPEELEAICLKATHKDASERYATAADFAGALRDCLHPSAIPERRWVVSTIAVLLLTIAASMIYALSTDVADQGDSTTKEPAPIVKGSEQQVPAQPLPLAVEHFDVSVNRESAPGAELFVPVERVHRIRDGDMVHISVELNTAAFIKLFWIDGNGEFMELHPHDPELGDLGTEPRKRVESPTVSNLGWPIVPVGNSEVALLLVDREPIEFAELTELQWVDGADQIGEEVIRYEATRSEPTAIRWGSQSSSAQTEQERGIVGHARPINDIILEHTERLRESVDIVHVLRIPTVAAD